MNQFQNKYLKYTVVLLAMILVYVIIDRNNRFHQLYECLDADLSMQTVEYGSNVKTSDLIRSHIGDLKIDQDIDTFKTGMQKLTGSLSKTEERYHQNVRKDFEFEIEVKDTKAPVIELGQETVYVYAGSGYDPKENIVDAYEPVDGKIEDVSVEGDYDPDRSGTYEVKAVARDKNGLTTEEPFTIIVRNQPVSGSEGYSIIYSHLTGTYGYNKAAACGILANIRYESNFNPDVGDYYYGLCQWGGSRKDDLFSYCAGNDLDASSVEGQLAYLDHEMMTSYPSVKNYLLSVEDSSSGAYSAAEYFCRHFEGAASCEGRGDLAASYYGS